MDEIEVIRSFNRTVTERVGALDEHFLGRGRPLGEARLLWEIGAGGDGGAEVRSLRQRLGMDSGYASRLLRSLEKQGLVVVEATAADGRVRCARLTGSGLAERAELDQAADARATSILASLDDRRRARLVTAMAEVERLLLASAITFHVEDPASEGARWCIRQYFAEIDERFENGFDPAHSLLPDVEQLSPPTGLFVVVRRRELPVGCGALLFHGGAIAELKRMWVAPGARGVGLGRRLLEELERRAAAAGTTRLRLETNRALGEAIALYRDTGYDEIEPYNDEPFAHHWFEKQLPASLPAAASG